MLHPFHREEEDVDPSLKEAINFTIDMGADLNEWRQREFSKLRALAESFEAEHERQVQRAHPDAQPTVAKLKAPLFRFLLEKHGYVILTGVSNQCIGNYCLVAVCVDTLPVLCFAIVM